MKYLIKFDNNGRRGETYVYEEKTSEEIQNLLDNGFEEVSEEDYQLLLGNIDGHEYIRKSDGSYSIYEPPTPDLEELKANKLAEVDAWTEGKITGGFTSECSGEIVRYDSDKDTQLTMQGIALNVSTERFKNEYPDGCPVRGYKEGETIKTIQYLNASQVYTWCADLSSHVGACKQQGWSKQAEVAAALSKEELDAIILD